jgi:uncharacterized Zn-binding protein involved in type VI secretion
MKGIARRGKDAAGGIIMGPSSSTVKADGYFVSLIGDKVASHGDSPHTPPPTLISNGAQKLKIDNKIPSKQGTLATCGHPVKPGSSTVKVS